MPDDVTAEEYLSDGLYVSFDGYYIWLRAPHLTMEHRVALDPQTLTLFEAYVARLRQALQSGGG